jgi:hypothetical protein
MSNAVMYAALLKLSETNPGAIHVKGGERMPESFNAFTRDELNLQRVIFNITSELKSRFYAQRQSACGSPQINYGTSGSCELIYLVTRPDVGSGNICITITTLGDGALNLHCVYGSLGLTAMRDGYRRIIRTNQMVHVAKLKHHEGTISDPRNVSRLCSEIMKLRDIEYFDVPIAQTVST